MPTATVATFNIRHGRGLDGRVDLERIADVIARTGADLIALQELDRFNPRSGEVDQPAELERLTGLSVRFCATVVRDGWEYGTALVSRAHEITVLSVEDLPHLGQEPRRILVARWGGVDVLATHLAHEPSANEVHVNALARLSRRERNELIVLGDLNRGPRRLAPLRSVGLRPAVLRRATLHPWWRLRQIDHVLVGDAISIERIRTVPTDASDHRPLVVDIRLPVEDVSSVTYDG